MTESWRIKRVYWFETRISSVDSYTLLKKAWSSFDANLYTGLSSKHTIVFEVFLFENHLTVWRWSACGITSDFASTSVTAFTMGSRSGKKVLNIPSLMKYMVDASSPGYLNVTSYKQKHTIPAKRCDIHFFYFNFFNPSHKWHFNHLNKLTIL